MACPRPVHLTFCPRPAHLTSWSSLPYSRCSLSYPRFLHARPTTSSSIVGAMACPRPAHLTFCPRSAHSIFDVHCLNLASCTPSPPDILSSRSSLYSRCSFRLPRFLQGLVPGFVFGSKISIGWRSFCIESGVIEMASDDLLRRFSRGRKKHR